MITFDDGIFKIYKADNLAPPGDKPLMGLKYKSEEYYGLSTVGIQRFYTALQNNQKIDVVANVHLNNCILVNDVVVDECGNQFIVRMVQLSEDEGLRYLKLSLERLMERYAEIRDN